MAVTDTLRDAAYITVGAGVLGFQKAQVRRQELLKQVKAQRSLLETQMVEGRKSLSAWATQLDELVTPVRAEVEARLDAVETTLPTVVRDVVKQVRTTVL